MAHYNTLGVDKSASIDDIKKAYRKLAMKHHPDRGGDETKFKEITAAHDILSDPQKKQQYDMGGNQQQHHGGFDPFGFHFNQGGFGGFGGFGPGQRNSNVQIAVEVTLNEVLEGKEITAELDYPGSGTRSIKISIPVGVEDNQQIRYQGLGDSGLPGPPGDLLVHIRIKPHAIFKREGTALVIDRVITVWDAMLGTRTTVDTLDGKTLNITIPAGTQPDTVFGCTGEGLPSMHTKQRGNLLIKVRVHVPKTLTESQVALINQIKSEL